jgi:WD40 repeat protein
VKVWDVARLPKPVTIACRQPVAEIAFAPNDSFLMTRSWSQMVALWDPETGSERAKLMEPYYPRIATKPEGRLGAVAYSPNGKKIVTASDISDEPREVSFRTGIYEKTAKLWDATTGKQQGVLAGHASWVYGVAFSPDGKSILTVSDDRSARLWDADSLELRGVLRPSESWINAAAFSPDSFTLATGSCDGTVKLWNVADAHERADLSGHRACITQIRFDPHGRTVLTIDTPDRRGGAALILWDAATGREIIGLHLSGPAAFSPDGATLAVCGQKDRETHLVTYNTQTGQELQSVRAHDWWIQDVAFAPDGHAIATASWDKTVKVWDATTIEPLATLNSPNWVDGIAFSRVGRKLAARVRDRSVVVWNTDNFQQRFQIDSEHSDSNGEIVFSPDGQTLAVIAMNSPPAKLYETETGSEIATLSGSEWTSFHFAADGQTIVTSNNNRGVTLWDAATYKERVRLVRQFNTGFSVTAVGISPDSQIVVTATTDRDRPVVIWHAATGREQATLKDYSGVVAQLAISPDSKTLATLNKGDAIVRLWDLSTGETRMTLAAHNNPVSCLEFSPNGKWLFTGSNSNEPSILWDVTSGTAVQKLELNKGGVAAVSFSRHSNLLATLGGSFGDKSVRLWDTITWTERGLIRSQTGVDSLAFTADSKSLVLREQGNALRSIWDPFVLQERQILPLIQQSDLHALPNFNDRNFGSIAFSADGRTLALAKSSAGLQDGVPIPNVLLLRAPAEQ